jgi:hypothetical protein
VAFHYEQISSASHAVLAKYHSKLMVGAGMRSQFLNSNDQTFNQAGNQVREALGARGNTGGNPVGGDYTRGLESLLGSKAQSQSQGLLGLQVQNQLQAQNNMFNAGNLLSGNAATLTGTQGVAGAGASSALNSYITAANSGFGQSFMSGLGKGLGGGLASFGTGALGEVASNLFQPTPNQNGGGAGILSIG